MGGIFSKKSKKAKAKKRASKQSLHTEEDVPYIDEGTPVDGPGFTHTVSGTCNSLIIHAQYKFITRVLIYLQYTCSVKHMFLLYILHKCTQNYRGTNVSLQVFRLHNSTRLSHDVRNL